MTKPYKCRVEYLESTGTQYIDTGYKPNSNTKVEAKFKMNSTPTRFTWLFLSRNENVAGGGFGFGCIANGSISSEYNNRQTSSTRLTSGTTYTITKDKNVCKFNNETLTNPASTFTVDYTLPIFTLNNVGEFKTDTIPDANCYYFRIYDNDVLVRDYIPVLDNNGRPAMYDNVSGQFFYNQGSGEFTYGRKIIPVEYLEGTGTQYIDTGYKPVPATTKFEFMFQCDDVTDNTFMFGSRPDTSAASQYTCTTYKATSRIRQDWAGLSEFFTGITTTDKYLYTAYNNTITLNDTTVTGTIARSTTRLDYNFLLFTVNTGGTVDSRMYVGKVYYAKLWDNGTLVRDFIPCIDENNVPFMFDLVNCKIYENAGTGQFKVGANVEKSGNKNFLRKKLDIYLATLWKKRPYYCELEYLEGTGTQYIDLGLKGKNNLDFDYKCIFTNIDGTAQCVGGNWSGAGTSTVSFYLGLIRTNGNFAYHYDGTQSPVVVMNTTVQDTPYSVQGHMWVGEQYMVINGTKSSVGTISSTFTSSLNMYLFGINNNGLSNPAYMKLYYCKIYDNGVLVRDMIPVLDWNYVPCMYDKVSGQFFYNQGSGTFQYGREIHYVDYIETDGTSFINTLYKPSGSTETEITTMLKDQMYSRFMFGCRSAQSNNTYACLAHSSNRIGYRVGTGSYLYSNGYDELNAKHTYKIANGVFYRDDVVINTTCQGATVSPNSPLALLTINTNNFLDTEQSFVGNFYSCTIKENNTLVRDYLPAIDENGVAFAFDRVTHTIFDNAGTGTFKYPAREVEYLEGTGTQYIDTGYAPSNTTGVEVKHTICANNGIDNIVFGCRQDSGNTRFWEDVDWTQSDSIGWGFNEYSNNISGYRCPLTSDMIGQTIISSFNFMNDRACKVNGVSYDPSVATKTLATITRPIYLFGANNQGNFGYANACKIFTAQISNEQTLVRDYIPVLQDGQAGMLDKVNNVFYPNAGTGSFVAGKIIESEFE